MIDTTISKFFRLGYADSLTNHVLRTSTTGEGGGLHVRLTGWICGRTGGGPPHNPRFLGIRQTLAHDAYSRDIPGIMTLIDGCEKVSGEILYHLATFVEYGLRNVISDNTS
jgi:hypothetical protein